MNRLELHGACHCGNLAVSVGLTRPAARYRPRACDCSFCRLHGAAYLSDPQGWLRLAVKDPALLGRYRQGMELADFLLCRRCGVLVAVVHADEQDRLHATLNSRVLVPAPEFGESVPVSSETLTEAQKHERWKANWFADVAIGPMQVQPR